MLNARIRKRWRAGNLPIGVIGEKADLTYDYDYLGAGPETLARARRQHALGEAAKRQTLVIVGQGALARPDGAAMLALAAKAARRGRRGQGRLERLLRCCTPRPSRVGALDIGFVPGEGGLRRAADGAGRRARCAVPARRRRDRHRAGRLRRLHRHAWRPRRASRRRHPAGRGLHRKNPASTSTPKAACRWPTRAGFPPGDAREDWAILRALSDVLGQKLPLRLARRSCARALFKAHPHLARIDQIAPGDAGRHREARRRSAARPTRRRSARRSTDFYLTNPIARASAVMAECSALARGGRRATAAE